MLTPGQTLENLANGDRVLVHQTAQSSGGRTLEIELWTVAQHPLGAHVHPTAWERFEILAGDGAYHLAGETRAALPGMLVELPPRVPHVNPWSRGGMLHVRQTISMDVPDVKALTALENAIETGVYLAQRNQLQRNGLPKNPLQLAVTLHDVRDVVYAAGMPRGVQRGVFGVLAALGHRLGYRAVYQ